MTTEDAPHEHLSMETAADFDERLLDGAASADVAARVASCATCADALDAIHRTRAALTELPAVPMPADVADRLHAALAAEAHASLVPGGAATVTALARPRRRLWIPIGAGVAAAGALVFALQLHGRPSTPAATAARAAASTSAAAAYSVTASARTLASGIDYKTTPRASVASRISVAQIVATSANGAAIDAKGAIPAPAGGSAMPTASAAASPATSASASASDSAPVPAAPTAASRPSAEDASTAAAASQPDGGVQLYAERSLSQYGPLLDRATLDSCVARLIDPAAPVQPTVIDYASYAGQPALAIYFPSAKAGQLDVFVVGLACGTTDDLLTYLRVPAAP